METKFRPLPLTILDFLGVLIPGLLWLVLLVKTYDAFTQGIARTTSMMESLKRVAELAATGGSWFGPLSITFAALTIGYSIKPLALRSADKLARPLFAIMPEGEEVSWRRLSFPYHEYFKGASYYLRARDILREITGVDPEELPRVGSFSGAKRYLHASAPSLWEESERMEAEVRMLGAMFLAALYSFVLHIILSLLGFSRGPFWAMFSLISAFFLAWGFNIVRFREVAHTYLNVVLAWGIQKKLSAKESAGQRAESEEDDG